MVKRSLFSAFVLVAVFICLVSMMCPVQTKAHFIPKGEVIAEYLPQDLLSTGGAEISPDGKITVIGDNPNIYLSDINREVTTVAVKLKEPIGESFAAIMYYDVGEGLSEAYKAYTSAFGDDKWVCFVIPSSYCYSARIDINFDYELESVNLYAQEPGIVEEQIQNPWWEYLLCAIISFVVSLAVFILDLKFKFLNQISESLKEKRISFLVGIIAFCSAVLLTFVIEIICGFVFDFTFNIYRCVFICGTLLCVAAFVICARSVAKKPENLVLSLVLILGMLMIFVSPFGHIAWDIDSHYYWALDASYIGDAYKTESDRYIINNQELYWPKESAVDNENNIETLNDSYQHVLKSFKSDKRITHIPSGIFIAVARMFGANFYWIYTLGRVPNLLIYAFACYFGMKKLKSGKMILAVIALFPTNIFLATNYSYDYWLIAFSILGVSYFVSEMQQPDKQISLKDNIIMCGALALACMPKEIYAPILLIPFFLRKTNFKNRKRYYLICALAFVALLSMFVIRSLSAVSAVGDARGGSAVNPSQQMEFIFSQPLAYAKILLNFLKSYLSLEGAKNYICNLAYLGYGYGHITMLAILIIAAFTDKNEYDLNNKYLLVKVYTVLLLLGMAALMATALYIDFTPVGSDIISGCQGRYLTPVLLPVLSIIGSKLINNKLNRTVYNYLILIPCSVVLIATIASTMLSRLV